MRKARRGQRRRRREGRECAESEMLRESRRRRRQFHLGAQHDYVKARGISGVGGRSSLGAGRVVAVASVLPYDVVAVVVSVGSR